ncbi:flavin monoamine oxidase family protein [Streptomyces albipurpureus]|uniref:FAD-dependent oxidoreductase n=1 Tax=Streptomyces albipurpureus TaxID=2897419 RepID=A0ABT0UG39_9ACTN|nr:FAD-dependent oxidoreductase [Streptomyces sp. CWNU-1]MCM2387597.1 FAD-dependent oxidoreductase [Streptomyces sp. CWNU-1]
MERFDVAVVGAGLAGLTSAVDLVAQGHRVVVLEARGRVGGRTTGQLMSDGRTIEMGGQWVGPTQDKVLELCEAYGLKTYPQHTAGEDLFVWGGEVSRYGAGESRVSAKSRPEVARMMAELEAMAATLDLEQPWMAARAREWDAMTLQSWLDGASDNAEAQAFWRIVAPAVFAAEAQEISLLHFLFYIASGGMFDILLGREGGAQERRVVGGSHLISEALAHSLGQVVRLSSPVHAIEHTADGAVVRYEGGAVSARRVVVALPPTLAGRLRYAPAMPALRDQFTQQVPMGSVIKVNVAYDRPFWREAGLSGYASSPEHPLSVAIDNTPHGSERGVLAGFVEGVHARRLTTLTREERRAVALECLVAYFGPQAAEPLEYFEKDWSSEEYSGGGYGGRLGTGVWTAFGPQLREPVGVIHWAGTETAAVWNGYMDGAVRSGHRVAEEIHTALSATPAH